MMRALYALVIWLLCAPSMLAAQGMANLVADRVTVTTDGRLIAEGNVEAFYDGTRLSAARITYDQRSDRLTIEGPLMIVAQDGTIMTADRGDLDPRLENGLLRGARLVLNQQMQIAANNMERVDGRYSALRQVAVTSCQVCGTRAPLWEIRAASVVHDQEAQQFYFEDATLRVRGVPVFWLPAMRLPDPTLERATGFLIPTIRTTDQLGVGVTTPYFITFGDSRDLMLTPYISPQTTTLEARYRQAFLRGDIEVEGAVSRDSVQPDQWRAYLFADGSFALDRDFVLDFNIQSVSDPSYLLDYGYEDIDRLSSSLTLNRAQDRSLFVADLTYYESLREDEVDATLPPLVGTLSWERRYALDGIGGMLTLGTGADTFVRPGETEGSDGRDMSRLGAWADWRRDWILPQGVLAEAALRLDLDAYLVSNDPDYGANLMRAGPAAAVTLRWPLMRATSRSGVAQIIEPILSLGYTATLGDSVPNEDSALVEFDEANLLALTRFPGQDAREDGARATVGLNWTRIVDGGGASTLTFGRIFRDQAVEAFTASSGLSGVASDWLIAGQVDLAGGFDLNARTLLNDDFGIGRTEALLDWANQRVGVTGAYLYIPADPEVNLPGDVSEWSLDARLQVNERWSVRAAGRYDLAADAPARAGFGIGWRNECVTVDLSVARRYTSSTIVEPSTSFGLTVNLNGFSAGRTSAVAAGSC